MEPTKPTIYFGIDLGTTNSVISWGLHPTGDDKFTPQVTSIKRMIERGRTDKRELLPSYVYFDEAGNTIIGEYAKSSIATSTNVVKSIKSNMGQQMSLNFHDLDYTPPEISAHILRMLADGAETTTGTRPQEVIITVPASFNPDQRAATLKAAELAGFTITDDILLDEPHAALYDFINRPNAEVLIDFATPKLVMVFDLGGGTLDVSIHRISYGQNRKLDISNVSIGRYSQIGGDKFDKELADHFLNVYRDHVNLPDDLDESTMTLLERRFQERAEQVKSELGTKYETQLRILNHNRNLDDEIIEPNAEEITEEVEDSPFEERSFHYTLTLAEYENIIKPLLGTDLDLDSVSRIDELTFDDDNIIYPILDALDKGKKALGDLPQIDAVLLNGGMTKLSIIKKRLETFFGDHTRIIEAGDADKAVALGAAYYHYDVASKAGRYHNKPNILPDTIGLEVTGGKVIPLVEAGTSLPSKPTKYDKLEVIAGKDHIELPFYSGRRSDTKPPNRKLLVQKVEFGKPLSKNEPVIIQMEVDERGILNVEGWLEAAPNEKFEATVGSGQSEETTSDGNGRESPESIRASQQQRHRLDVDVELKELRKLLRQYPREYETYRLNIIMEQIRNLESKIVDAANASEFIDPLITSVRNQRGRFEQGRMMILLGRLALNSGLTNNNRYDILKAATELSNPNFIGRREAAYVNSVMREALVAIGKTQLPAAQSHLLQFFEEDMPISVRQAAIIAIGKCCLDLNAVRRLESLIESSDERVRIPTNWSLGKIGRRERTQPIPIQDLGTVIDALSKQLWVEQHDQGKQQGIYALGEICDRREHVTDPVNQNTAEQVIELLETFLRSQKGTSFADFASLAQSQSNSPLQKRALLAIRMIKGEILSVEEERSLLKIREDD